MPNKTISQLPAAASAESLAVVAADNAAATVTQKVTLGQIASLAAGSAPVQSVAGRTGAVTLAVADVSNAVATSDARLSDSRTPTAGSVTDASITPGGLAASTVNWNSITAWQPSTAYAKGDLVHYLGIAYRRTTAGSSGPTFNAAAWTQVTAPVSVTATPATISANTNDYALAIGSADIFRISSSAAINITGITAGLIDGHSILLRNVGGLTITLKHQDAGSVAANRIIVPWSGDAVLSANGSILLLYDSTLARWIVT